MNASTALKLSGNMREIPLNNGKATSLLGQMVDRLGYVQAEMAPLKTEEEQLKVQLRASKEVEIEGDLFRATISYPQPGQKTDWETVARAIAAKAGLTTKQWDKFVSSATAATKPGEGRVSIKSRKGTQ